MAGIIGTSLLGLPTEASGETKSKRQSSNSKSGSKTVTRPSKGSSPKTTSPKPDYKSKYRKKDPPPNGSRPPKQKENRPPGGKNKQPRGGGGDYKRPIKPVLPPNHDDRGHDHPIIYPPPVIIIDPYPVYQEPYYEETYYVEPRSTDHSVTAAIVLSTASVGLNYVFIRSGQTNGFAATAGLIFGITSLAVASRSNAQHAFLGYLVGASAIAFSVWNLSGGMAQTHTYEDTELYDPYSYATAAPAGQTVGWSFSF
jgi:hypothetical protein